MHTPILIKINGEYDPDKSPGYIIKRDKIHVTKPLLIPFQREKYVI